MHNFFLSIIMIFRHKKSNRYVTKSGNTGEKDGLSIEKKIRQILVHILTIQQATYGQLKEVLKSQDFLKCTNLPLGVIGFVSIFIHSVNTVDWKDRLIWDVCLYFITIWHLCKVEKSMSPVEELWTTADFLSKPACFAGHCEFSMTSRNNVTAENSIGFGPILGSQRYCFCIGQIGPMTERRLRNIFPENRSKMNDVNVLYVTSGTSSFHIFWHTKCNYKKYKTHIKYNIFKTTARKL